jgi:hypothetical protein
MATPGAACPTSRTTSRRSGSATTRSSEKTISPTFPRKTDCAGCTEASDGTINATERDDDRSHGRCRYGSHAATVRAENGSW